MAGKNKKSSCGCGCILSKQDSSTKATKDEQKAKATK